MQVRAGQRGSLVSIHVVQRPDGHSLPVIRCAVGGAAICLKQILQRLPVTWPTIAASCQSRWSRASYPTQIAPRSHRRERAELLPGRAGDWARPHASPARALVLRMAARSSVACVRFFARRAVSAPSERSNSTKPDRTSSVGASTRSGPAAASSASRRARSRDTSATNAAMDPGGRPRLAPGPPRSVSRSSMLSTATRHTRRDARGAISPRRVPFLNHAITVGRDTPKRVAARDVVHHSVPGDIRDSLQTR